MTEAILSGQLSPVLSPKINPQPQGGGGFGGWIDQGGLVGQIKRNLEGVDPHWNTMPYRPSYEASFQDVQNVLGGPDSGMPMGPGWQLPSQPSLMDVMAPPGTQRGSTDVPMGPAPAASVPNQLTGGDQALATLLAAQAGGQPAMASAPLPGGSGTMPAAPTGQNVATSSPVSQPRAAAAPVASQGPSQGSAGGTGQGQGQGQISTPGAAQAAGGGGNGILPYLLLGLMGLTGQDKSGGLLSTLLATIMATNQARKVPGAGGNEMTETPR